MSSSEIIQIVNNYDWDFGIDVRIENPNGGNFYIEAPLQTQKLIPDEILRKYFQTAHNKGVRSFHIPPEEDIESHIGNVEKVWWDEVTDKPWCRLKIFDNSVWARTVQRIVLEDAEKPYKDRRIKGVSAGIIEYRNKKTNELTEIYIHEVSLARNPACDICTFKTIVLNEEGGKKLSEKKETNQMDTIMKNYDARIADKEKKIKEYSQTIKIQYGTIKSQKSKIEELETEMVEYEKVKDELAKIKKDIETFPIRSKILKYGKISPNDDLYSEKMKELVDLSTESLNIMLSHFERVYKIEKKGLGDKLNGPVLDTPGIQNFDGNDISDLKGIDLVKAVDQQVEALSTDKTKGTGGY